MKWLSNVAAFFKANIYLKDASPSKDKPMMLFKFFDAEGYWIGMTPTRLFLLSLLIVVIGVYIYTNYMR